MSRGNTAAMDTALEGQVLRWGILGLFEFDSGDVRLWSGEGNLTWGADVFQGVGTLLDVEFPEEANDGSATGATFVLSGVDPVWDALALTENYQNRPCTLWFAAFDESGVIVADPIPFFPGVTDVMSLLDDADNSEVRLSVERSALDNRAPGLLYDDKTQQRLFPGDKGFELLTGQEERMIHWGVPGAGQTWAPNPPVVDHRRER